MKTRFLIPTAIVVAIFSPGCTRQDTFDDTPAFRTVEVAGSYAAGFEYSVFSPSTPEFKGQEWWLNSNQEFNERYAEFYGNDNEPGRREFGLSVVVRLRGRLMGPGKYGHLDQWKYNFTVEEVLEMQRVKPKSVGEPASRDESASGASEQAWGNLKGRVVFAGDEIPEPKLIIRKGGSER